MSLAQYSLTSAELWPKTPSISFVVLTIYSVENVTAAVLADKSLLPRLDCAVQKLISQTVETSLTATGLSIDAAVQLDSFWDKYPPILPYFSEAVCNVITIGQVRIAGLNMFPFKRNWIRYGKNATSTLSKRSTHIQAHVRTRVHNKNITALCIVL